MILIPEAEKVRVEEGVSCCVLSWSEWRRVCHAVFLYPALGGRGDECVFLYPALGGRGDECVFLYPALGGREG